MDGAKLQAKVYSGFARAAKRIGLPHDLYRPIDPLNPLGNKIATLPADFRAGNDYMAPNKYGVATWLGTYDAAQVVVGDYFMGPAGTFFVAQQSAYRNPYVVGCNAVVNVVRAAGPSGVGAVGYSGATAVNEAQRLAGWPASVLRGQPGEKNTVGVPMDERMPWFQVLLPPTLDVVVSASDVIVDDMERRYVASQVELTDLGWRIMAQEALV